MWITDTNMSAGLDDDAGDEDGEDMSSQTKFHLIKNAISSLRDLSNEMDLDQRESAETIRCLEKLLTAAVKTESQQKEEKRRTDYGPLHFAALRNNKRPMASLLDKGAIINAQGGLGSTALHIAASCDSFDAMQFLLLQECIDMNAVDRNDTTALFRAIVAGSLRCALLLVRSGANVDIGRNDGLTPLHAACLKKDMDELVITLLEKTTKVNSQNEDALTPIHCALWAQNVGYIMPLLDAGADLNLPDKTGRAAMHQACFESSAELLLLLVDRDVDFTIKGKQDETILHLLCQRDLCEVAQAVVKKPGVDINARTVRGITPLILAAANNSYRTLKMLIDYGADVTATDQDLDTALTIAIRDEHDDMADLLIKRGSPVNPQGQSTTKWKARLERNRKAQQALSAPTLNVSVPQSLRHKEATIATRSHSAGMARSPSSKHLLQAIGPEISKAVTQAISTILTQDDHPLSQKTSNRHTAHGQ